PISVKSLHSTNLTTYSVSLTWSKPDEYQTLYRYRVQTNVTSSGSIINNMIVTNESVTIMNLTSGETYTFMVYTRAADNITESDPVSLLPICTGAEQVSISSVVNNQSVSSLVVNWTPATVKAKVDYYNAILSGVIQRVSNSTTQAIFTGLVPGTEYTATVQIVSGNCNQSSLSVTEATYPTAPSNLIIGMVGTKNLTLSWSEPSLISGTNYSITVVTVGVRGYQSSPVTTSVYTKPMSVKSLQIINATSYSVSLTWSKPDEYQTSYSYRVQTFNSSASMVNNTIVTSESVTIMNLTPGETYTFLVYTRAADNSTESDPVSNTTCTVPGQVSTITMNNYQSVDVLGASWIKPGGKVDNYTVSLTGAINKTTQTTSTQVNFTGLLPGREYNVTVQTVSGSCSQTSAPVTEATYPTPPGTLSFTTITTKNLTLSWLEPVNMAGVNKIYNISYGISPSTTLSVTSPTTSVTLQSLISGTNYSITVVTVGVRGYQSSPVTTSVYTKPMPVKSLQIGAVTTYSVSLSWNKPDEYQTSYSYRVQTNVTSSATMVYNTIVTSESATIMNLTPGETYTYLIYTRAADNSTESDPVLNTTCANPDAVNDFNCVGQFNSTSLNFTWSCPGGLYTGFTIIATNKTSTTNNVSVAKCNPDPYSYTMNDLSFNTNYTASVITLTSCGRSSTVILATCQTGIGSPAAIPEQNITGITPTYYTLTSLIPLMDLVVGYAIIVSRSYGNGKPSQNDLLNTYDDFKSKKTDAYVAKIIQKNKSSQRSGRAATQTVTIGDDSNDPPYKNGGLDPGTAYWIAIAGFTKLERDPNGYISPKSLGSITDYQGSFKTENNAGMIAGAVVGSILGAIVIGVIVFFIVKMRRKGEKKNSRVQLPSIKRSQTMSTNSFISHFDRQKADCNLGFSEEYEKLSSVGTKQTKLFADEVENREKNRYTNVLPYDVSRVVLSSVGNPTEDYINANYIPGYNSTKEYIAAQGPLPRTVNDFWRMIWEKNVRAVIMLTKCVELGKVKCEEYWPQRSARIYGNLSVSMNDENVLQDWTTRDFTLVDMKTRQSKVVRHFHFTAWPDHGVPKATSVLIEFRNLVREYVTNDDSMHSPIVVHCSAGVGRTGTLIALDRVMKQIETESQIDVYGDSQYIFLNQCALDIIKAPRMNDPDLIYQNTSAIYQNTSTSSFKKTNF
ncbi:unnamed protein product, partial [Ranitomeya imitator]